MSTPLFHYISHNIPYIFSRICTLCLYFFGYSLKSAKYSKYVHKSTYSAFFTSVNSFFIYESTPGCHIHDSTGALSYCLCGNSFRFLHILIIFFFYVFYRKSVLQAPQILQVPANIRRSAYHPLFSEWKGLGFWDN